ncbi:MAG: hypothetical protein WCP14_03245 [bacterium]
MDNKKNPKNVVRIGTLLSYIYILKNKVSKSPLAIHYRYRETQIALYKLMLNNNDINLDAKPKYAMGEKHEDLDYSNGTILPIKVGLDHTDVDAMNNARSYVLNGISKIADGKQFIDYFDWLNTAEGLELIMQHANRYWNLNEELAGELINENMPPKSAFKQEEITQEDINIEDISH